MVAAFGALPALAATSIATRDELPALSPPYAELPPSFGERYGSWIIAGAVLLSLCSTALVLWWRLRVKPAISVPIETQTRRELEQLIRRAQTGSALSQVSRCLRHYLTVAFELPREELTTAEFNRLIQANEKIGPDVAAKAGVLLQRLDALKFAPQPPVGDGEHSAAANALNLVDLAEARRAWLQSAKHPSPAVPSVLPK